MQCASVTLLRQISVSPGPGRNFTQSHKEHKEAISITHSLLPAGQKSDKKNQGSVHIVQSLQAVHAVNTFSMPRLPCPHETQVIPDSRIPDIPEIGPGQQEPGLLFVKMGKIMSGHGKPADHLSSDIRMFRESLCLNYYHLSV